MKRMNIYILLLFLPPIIAISCSKSNPPCGSDCDQTAELIFHSGFEPSTTGIPPEAITELTGTDLSFTEKNNWVKDLDSNAYTGDFSIQYQGGDTSMRYARLVPGPENPLNTTLLFSLSQPNVDGIKGRIQANLYENTCMKEIYEKIRFYLSSGFNLLLGEPGSPAFNWLTLFEFWNNGNWTGEDYPFRVTVNLEKTDTGVVQSLYFESHGQIIPKDVPVTTIWEETNLSVPVPVEQWVQAEIYLKEGDDGTGRFFFTITPEGGTRQVVFDIRGYTYHPGDPCPDGFGHFNPMKLYTSAGLLQYIRDRGGKLQIYWDDFELWRNKQPE